MASLTLLHNPTAGDEDHSGEHLKGLIESEGYDCSYVSAQAEGWENFRSDTSFVAVAGGDGTVRKVVKTLIDAGKETTLPIAVLPSGTANNIARSLCLEDDHDMIVKGWKSCPVEKVDIGQIHGGSDEHFFLESFGFGLLPRLMKEMEKLDEKQMDTPEQELEAARRLLHDITLGYEANHCKVIVDGKDYSGKYLMVEVLNMAFVGPNLNMAPEGGPGDGMFEVVLLTEEDRDAFASFVLDPANSPLPHRCRSLQGKRFELNYEGADLHADDQLISRLAGEAITIEAKQRVLSFLV